MTLSQSQSVDASIQSACPEESSQTQNRSVWRRIAIVFAKTFVVSFSLLCFPKWLPAMVAFWLLWQTLLMAKGELALFPVATCFLVLLIRLVAPTPLMLGMVGVLLVTSVVIYRTRRQARKSSLNLDASLEVSKRPLIWLAIVAMWTAWALMTWEYRSGEQGSARLQFDVARPVVCIGDSLTQGMIPDRGYPGQLESMVHFPVVNKGVSGVSTGPAIGILQRAMELNPQVVVIELGGHDFLKWHSRSSAKKNLTRMIEICREHDADVILMEIPRGFMVDPYAGLERELAYRYDLELVDDRWLRHVVLMSPIAPPGRWLEKTTHLSDDGIHSNEKGSRHIAKFVRGALVNLYGKEVLKSSD